MIITKLKGGLGNQLFQYAAGRALALRNNDIVKLDITGYGEYNGIDTVRQYALGVFSIQENIATPHEIQTMKNPYRILSKGMRFFRAKILREFTTNFNKRIFNLKGNSYIDGYFQSEQYFKDQEAAIRKDIQLKISPSSVAQKAAEDILRNTKSVSLHVRRGDYVQDAKTNQYHGTCNPQYYANALAHISSKIGDGIKVFVFSDDIGWVKENMPIPYEKTYVSSPEIKDYEEMHLMSLCKHNIIANSSFSWWGAWLNMNPSKVVIAPKHWTVADDKHYRDIVPSAWTRL
jgi:hypothetical protein